MGVDRNCGEKLGEIGDRANFFRPHSHPSRKADPVPRFACIAPPGVAYHVTRRGNRLGDLFLDGSDREVCRLVLARLLKRAGCRLWG